MSAVPPSNGKSAPLPLILRVWATPRSSMMSPPANEGPRRAGIERRAGGRGRQRRRQRPVGEVGDPADAEERLVAPRRARARPDRRHRPAGTRVACGSWRGPRSGPWPRRPRRAVTRRTAARHRARRGSASASPRHELERVVAGALPGEHVRDLLARGGRGGGPVLGDRHDRDVARAARARRPVADGEALGDAASGGRRGGRAR